MRRIDPTAGSFRAAAAAAADDARNDSTAAIPARTQDTR